MSARQFTRLVVAVTLFALVIRWVYLSNVGADQVDFGDALHYHELANLLADGKGFLEPIVYTTTGVEMPAASHPPLWPIVLGVSSLLGGRSFFAHQVVGVLIGTATIPLVALTGREIAGRRVGVIAAAIAAVHPGLWIWDAQLLAETLAIFTVCLLLFTTYRFWHGPTRRTAMMMGAVCGLAALSRSESILLFVLVLVPLTLRPPDPARAQRWTLLGGAALGLALVLLPWFAYNLTRFDRPVLLSDQLGVTLAAANCDSTYYTELIGYWNIRCVSGYGAPEVDEEFDRSEADRYLQQHAISYAREHVDRLPVVMANRVGRLWLLRDPVTQIRLEWYAEGRSARITEAAVFSMFLLAYLSFWGALELRRRRILVWPLVAVILSVTITSALVYGVNRFRAPAEVALVLLAAVAVDAGIRVLETRPRVVSGQSESRTA